MDLHVLGELREIGETRGLEQLRHMGGGVAHADEELHRVVGEQRAQLRGLAVDHRPDLRPLDHQPVDADEARVRQDQPVDRGASSTMASSSASCTSGPAGRPLSVRAVSRTMAR
jgi:hypothetical protein